MTPNQFAQLLGSRGILARLSVAGGRIAQILCEVDGLEFTITFLPWSEDGSSVDDFCAFTFLMLSKVPSYETFEVANELNKRARFLRYFVEGEVMSIEMDVAVPKNYLDDELALRQVDLWMIAISRYRLAVSA